MILYQLNPLSLSIITKLYLLYSYGCICIKPYPVIDFNQILEMFAFNLSDI